MRYVRILLGLVLGITLGVAVVDLFMLWNEDLGGKLTLELRALEFTLDAWLTPLTVLLLAMAVLALLVDSFLPRHIDPRSAPPEEQLVVAWDNLLPRREERRHDAGAPDSRPRDDGALPDDGALADDPIANAARGATGPERAAVGVVLGEPRGAAGEGAVTTPTYGSRRRRATRGGRERLTPVMDFGSGDAPDTAARALGAAETPLAAESKTSADSPRSEAAATRDESPSANPSVENSSPGRATVTGHGLPTAAASSKSFETGEAAAPPDEHGLEELELSEPPEAPEPTLLARVECDESVAPKHLAETTRLAAAQPAGPWRGAAASQQTDEFAQANEAADGGDAIAPGGVPLSAHEHLRDFLARHLEELEDGLRVYIDPAGRLGVAYPTPLGPVDILARDDHGFVVVQVLVGDEPADCPRMLGHIGWIRRHLAKNTLVRGVILAEKLPRDFDYILAGAPHLRLYEYEFSLSVREAIPRQTREEFTLRPAKYAKPSGPGRERSTA